ncbi:hypothetical protein C6A87_013835 [Mycobacterium sp. ITM-2016-00317]|uniref:hypothetical protein n=1 Tax=Mycobacterium sp. ITM-2016-00317 TaxID=2099694 RepID=UPI00287FD14E|nr:hypothetical protein [Mycobacterium sp. ITM-2016-00317]WNG90101.1 hypothetical protein C6A87_013835 [Mycobacterium sp. ITM-2016-00317]
MLAARIRSAALDMPLGALAPFTFPLSDAAFPFVRGRLALVCGDLAFVSDPVTLVGDAFSFVREPFASRKRVVAVSGQRLAVRERFALSVTRLPC